MMTKNFRLICVVLILCIGISSFGGASALLPYPALSASPSPSPSPAPSVAVASQKVTPKPRATKAPKTPKPSPTPKPITVDAIRKALLKLMNESRAEQRTTALKIDSTLNAAAQIRAKELNEKFGHYRPDGSFCLTVSNKAYGENIASLSVHPLLNTAEKLAEAIHESWMQSPPHCRNVLYAKYKIVGLGYVLIDDMQYWVQLFGY